MQGRTYRYLETPPLYPFGYGLSYTRFAYKDLTLSPARPAATTDLCVSVGVTVENTGGRDGDEVVQLYVADREASCRVPQRDLRGFRRLHLAAGESRRLEFQLTARDLSLIDERGHRQLEPGRFLISVGGSQPDERSAALTGTRPLAAELELVGEVIALSY
jgi:beta-glucosidase